MSLAKSQVKLAVVNDIGNRFDDMLEAAVGQQQQCLGAIGAAKQIRKNMETLAALASKDQSEGKIGKAMKEGELAVFALIKSYISRAMTACEATAANFESMKAIATGKVDAFKQSVSLMHKMHTSEATKVERILASVESGDAKMVGQDAVLTNPNADRPTGVKPDMNIKEQRLAEEAARKGNGEKNPDDMTPEELEAYLMQ
jgi:hypothetical protein